MKDKGPSRFIIGEIIRLTKEYPNKTWIELQMLAFKKKLIK